MLLPVVVQSSQGAFATNEEPRKRAKMGKQGEKASSGSDDRESRRSGDSGADAGAVKVTQHFMNQELNGDAAGQLRYGPLRRA